MAETASLSFKLKKEVLARELVFDKTGNDFHVNLRTKEVIAENKEHEKIKNELGFKPAYSIKNAVKDLKQAFEKGLLNDPMNNSLYYNIKRMKEINLK